MFSAVNVPHTNIEQAALENRVVSAILKSVVLTSDERERRKSSANIPVAMS